MMISQWCRQPFFRPVLPIIAGFLALAALSCSGGGHGPAAPPITVDEPLPVDVRDVSFQPGHNVMGYCTVHFDPQTGVAQVRFHRTVEVHLNLSAFLNHPNCPDGSCLTWYVVGFDSQEEAWIIDMNLVNPTIYTAYDMRIIFVDLPGEALEETAWEVANPDSYTHAWDSDPEWDEDEQWLNPFIAFEKEDINREFLPDPDGSGPEIYSDTEKLLLRVPPGSRGGEIVLIVDACWPGHCYEPYDIFRMRQPNDLPPLNSSLSVYFECIVADWQEDIADVSIYIPDIVSEDDDYLVQMTMWPKTGPDKWPPPITPPYDQEEIEFIFEFANYDWDTLHKYYCHITNDQEARRGEYDAIIVAESDDLAGQNIDTLYNRVKIIVDVGGGGDDDDTVQVGFSSYRNGNADLFTYLFAAPDEKIYQLTEDFIEGEVHSDELEICVDAIGGKIAFISNYNQSEGILDDFEVYVVNVDYNIGTGLPDPVPCDQWIQVTDNPWDDRTPDFSWSGGMLAYASRRNGQYDIFTVPTGGPYDNEFRVTLNFAEDEAPNYNKSDPTERSLFFMSNRSGGGNYEIYEVDSVDGESAGDPATRWTFNSAFDGYPSSRGLGGWGFAFQSDRDGSPDIWFFDGTDLVQVTEGDPIDMFPSFSPLGRQIAFMSDRFADNFEICRISTEGGSPRRMTWEDMPDMDPCYGGSPH